MGLRHDGGDAETGAGMDVGAGLIVSDTSTGLAVDVRVRMLLVHQDRRVPRAGPVDRSQLQPDALDAAGRAGDGDPGFLGRALPPAALRRSGTGRRWPRAAAGDPAAGAAVWWQSSATGCRSGAVWSGDAERRHRGLRHGTRLPAGLWPDGGAGRRPARRAGR